MSAAFPGYKVEFSDFAAGAFAIDDVAGLEAELGTKAAAAHTHVRADITNFPHTHSQTEISGLETDLAEKAEASSVNAELADLGAAINAKPERLTELLDCLPDLSAHPLEYLRINALGTAVEAEALTINGLNSVGDIVFKPYYREPASNFPFLPLWNAGFVSATHWPDLQPFLDVQFINFDNADEFGLVAFGRISNVVYLELVWSRLEYALFEDLYFQSYNYETGNVGALDYSAWRQCVDIPDLGPIGPGRYQITSLEASANTIVRFALPGPDIARTLTSETVQFPMYGVEGSATLCYVRSPVDAVFRTPGFFGNAATGLRKLDRFQEHWHTLGSSDGQNLTTRSYDGTGLGLTEVGAGAAAKPALNRATNAVTKTGAGTPRVGLTTRDRSIVVCPYLYGGRYLP